MKRTLATILTASMLVGCPSTKASTRIHSALNRTTVIVDPIYDEAVDECDVREGAIIEEGTEREATATALQQLRERCNALFGIAEAARAQQESLRVLADAYADGEITEEELWAGLEELLILGQQMRDAWRLFRGGE